MKDVQFSRSGRARDRGRTGRRRGGAPPGVEGLESRVVLDTSTPRPFANPALFSQDGVGKPQGLTGPFFPTPPITNNTTLTPSDVDGILNRAAAATPGENAIVAVVDRGGHILGVRVEGNVSPAITGNPEKLTFAIDGAVAEARTAAFFASNQAPLTSRTIQDISQSTMTQREVESDPNIPDPNSPLRGPGFVAPVGLKGHFPAFYRFQTQVDLFQIEHTNRDSIVNPGPDHIRGTPDDVNMALPTPARPLGSERFNINLQFVPPGQEIPAPESYGFVSGVFPSGQARGVGTLPGGIPLLKAVSNPNDPQFSNGFPALVGGVGVFFPGTTGFATEENSYQNEASFFDRNKPDLSQEAEFIAFVAAGGSGGPLGGGIGAQSPVGLLQFNQQVFAQLQAQFPNGIPGFQPLTNANGTPVVGVNGKPVIQGVPGFNLIDGRIDLVGITLDIFGPNSGQGPRNLVEFGQSLLKAQGLGSPFSGFDYRVDTSGNLVAQPATTQFFTIGANGAATPSPGAAPLIPHYLGSGQTLPQGWLVLPHDAEDGSGLTAADVYEIITRGIQEAQRVRAAIRLPLDRRAAMMISVADKSGNILGLFRMPDTTFFSIDVAVAKSRNVAYYANPNQLQPIDQIPGLPPGTAITNRSIRYLAEPRFPEAIDGYPPGPFSILNDGGVNKDTGAEVGPALPASAFQSVQGFDSFNPQTNFHQPWNLNQDGIVFFPGSVPLYKDLTGTGVRQLVGGLGVSGDGVDQDDDVTFQASKGFEPPFNVPRIDFFKIRGVRVPYQKFNRQPHEPYGDGFEQHFEPPGTAPGGGFRPILPRKNPGPKTTRGRARGG